jgi:integrase
MAKRKAAKRDYGSGSVYESRGYWWAQAYQNGRLTRRRRATREDAEAALNEINELRAADVNIERGRQSVEAFSAYWYNEDVLQRDNKARTNVHYLDTLERYVLTAIGTRRLLDVTHAELQTLLNDLRRRDRPLSPQTIKHVKGVIEQLFACALKNGYLKHNPAIGLVAPKVRQPTRAALDVGQVRQFLDAIEGYRLSAAYHVMATLGLRVGEVLAIRRIDVDFAAGTLTIAQQTSYHTALADTPKSETGKRVLPVPPRLLGRLRAAWDAVKPEADWVDHGLLFPSTTGTRKAPRTFEREWTGQQKKVKATKNTPAHVVHLPGLRERGGLPAGVTLHDFRRFCATSLGGMDIHPMTLKHILGHGAGDVTERYIKRQIATMRDALEAHERALWGDVKTAQSLTR